MLGLARFAMKSPKHLGILAALFAVVPMLYVFSAALVALTTLRHGFTAGTRVLLWAMIGAIVSWQLSGVPFSMLVLSMATILAFVLRSTQSWSRTLLVGALLGIGLAVVAQGLFQEQFDAIVESIQALISEGDESSANWLVMEMLRPSVGFVILSSQYFEALLALLLARYWQAGLYNPGGLKAEMHAMRFTWQEAIVWMVAISLAIMYQPFAIMLLGIALIFAGMALIHAIVAKLKLGGQWIVAAYIALILFNQIILPLLVLAVLVDSVIDIRSRIPERTQSDNE